MASSIQKHGTNIINYTVRQVLLLLSIIDMVNQKTKNGTKTVTHTHQVSIMILMKMILWTMIANLRTILPVITIRIQIMTTMKEFFMISIKVSTTLCIFLHQNSTSCILFFDLLYRDGIETSESRLIQRRYDSQGVSIATFSRNYIVYAKIITNIF